MQLRPMLAIPTAVIMLVTCALVAMLAIGALHDWRQGEQGRYLQHRLRQALVLQETLARERGPTDMALSEADPLPATLLADIADARRMTDVQLRALVGAPGLSDRGVRGLTELEQQLAAARTEADRLLQIPAADRGVAAIGGIVDAMMRWSEAIFPTIEDLLEAAVAANPESDSLLTAARATSDLRYYAGSISGWLTIGLAKRQPMSLAMVYRVQVLQGRIQALQRELMANIRSANAEDTTQDAVANAEQGYFGSGQRLVEQVLATEASTGDFDATRLHFRDRNRSAMASLVVLRDRLLDLANDELELAQRERLHRLAVISAAGVLVVLMVVAALMTLHWRVLRPLSELAAMVIRLAQGDRSVQLPVRRGSREVVELARAIEVLRVATLAADAEAARRHVALQRWTAQLQEVLATIDLVHDRTAVITDLLPTLLEQLDTLASRGGLPASGLVEAIIATREGMSVLREASVRLDAALHRVHAVSVSADGRVDALRDALAEVADVVATIEASVNALPRMTLSAMRDLPRRVVRDAAEGALERILAQVQEMAAAAGGLKSALQRANQGVGELARLRA